MINVAIRGYMNDEYVEMRSVMGRAWLTEDDLPGVIAALQGLRPRSAWERRREGGWGREYNAGPGSVSIAHSGESRL